MIVFYLGHIFSLSDTVHFTSTGIKLPHFKNKNESQNQHHVQNI